MCTTQELMWQCWLGRTPAFQRMTGAFRMRQIPDARGSIVILAVGIATSWSVPAALAACGMAAVNGGASGPPSISTTETSTTQVLEQIRRRTQEAQSPQPIPVSNETAPAPDQSSAPVEEAAPKPAPKPAAPAASSAAAKPAPVAKPTPVIEAAPATVSKPAKKAPAADSTLIVANSPATATEIVGRQTR